MNQRNDSHTTEPPKRRSWPVRLLRALGSVQVGCVLVALVLFYLGAVSLLAQTHPAETDFVLGPGMAPYRHPLLAGLAIALCVSLLLASWARVRLDWPRLGAWISHLGVFVAAVGVVWYATCAYTGWIASARRSPTKHLYVEGTASLLAYTPEHRQQARSVDLPVLPESEDDQDIALDIALDFLPEGVQGRVVRFLSAAGLWQYSANDSPIENPGVFYRVSQGDRTYQGLFSPLYRKERLYLLDECGLVFVHSAAPADVERVAERRVFFPHLYLLTGPEVLPRIVVVLPNGESWEHLLRPLDPNDPPGMRRYQPVEIPLELPVTFEFLQLYDRMAIHNEVPADEQLASQVTPTPALQIELSSGDWRESVWVPFTPVPDWRYPGIVPTPVGPIHLQFTRSSIEMPVVVDLLELDRPMGSTRESGELRAYLLVYPPDVDRDDLSVDVRTTTAPGGPGLDVDGPAEVRSEILTLHRPVQAGPYQLTFANVPASDDELLLRAAYRPGMGLIWVGLAMIVTGMLYAFYVKPLILRRRARR